MKCPGQDTRYWDSNAIFNVNCPSCGHPEEFFKDESSRKCKKCGYRIMNPKMDKGCAAYCKFAEQCLGELSNDRPADELSSLKDRVAVEMKQYFGSDARRINHANKVAQYGEQIAKELNADMAVVYSAAYLHDIGIKDAERIYNSNSAKYQEELGPGIARGILSQLNAGKELIDKVCDIIGHHHHPRETETSEFKALFDADQIVNIEEDEKDADKEKIARMIENRLLTDSGRVLARKALL
ncbi:MAG: HD domain-containing protein [Spirochaetota bacterium]